MVPGWVLGAIAPVGAQSLPNNKIIPNTATANFQSLPGGPLTNTISNTVTVQGTSTSLEIIKVGDRAAAEPGDTVIYRLLVRNTGGLPINNIVVSDDLPLGFRFIQGSTRGSLTDPAGVTPVTVGTTVSGQRLNFTYPRLAPREELTIVYATIITPDAIRGSGRNTVVALGVARINITVQSNVSTHLVKIRPGILADCGTVLGRVFVDKNFDGEQQDGEPGVPNAVVFLNDGNRVVTDPEGLFSVICVPPGYMTGTLDLTSLPGYTSAPNLYRIETNSPSRMVRIAPGSIARMNFAVTPAFREEKR